MDMSTLVPPTLSISERLEKRFGLGTRPDLRRALYHRMEALCTQADSTLAERCYQVVASVVADATGKSKPGNYFAAVSVARLQEKGLLEARAAEF